MLRHIRTQRCLCAAATHDIELARMLSGYVNFHFGEQITENGVEFDYTIKPGPSVTRNAIKLLDVMEFDRKIVENAERLVSDLKRRRPGTFFPESPGLLLPPV